MGWLSGWLTRSGDDQSLHAEALRYDASSRTRIRKWVNQFSPWEMVADAFWNTVQQQRLESGQAPGAQEVLTALLNERRQSGWDQGQLGWYRNDTLGLCKLAAQNNDHRPCLSLATIVLILDACGANNDGWHAQTGPFRSGAAFVSTSALLLFARSARHLGYDAERLHTIFVEAAESILTPLGSARPDVSHGDLWKLVRVDLTRELKSRFTERAVPSVCEPVL
ncbi:hypothetical protein [Orrella marina]|nr:hypothetical protein [Orrella marina]